MPSESLVFNNRTVQKLQVEDRVDLQDFPPAGLYLVAGVQSSGNTFFVDLHAEVGETKRRLILQRGFRLRVLAEEKEAKDKGDKPEASPVGKADGKSCATLAGTAELSTPCPVMSAPLPTATRPHASLFPG